MKVQFGKLSFIFVSIFPYDPADPINKDELKPEHARRSSSFVFRSRSLLWLESVSYKVFWMSVRQKASGKRIEKRSKKGAFLNGCVECK